MYDLSILSIFRDSTKYLPRYLSQVRSVLPHFERACLVWLEGDSVDGTYDVLMRAGCELRDEFGVDVLLTRNYTGKPYYPSTELPERWEHLTETWNRNLDAWKENAAEDDSWCVVVESDLIWDWPTLQEMMCLVIDEADVAAPGLWKQDTGVWYETNGMRRNGQKFSNFPPYAPDWDGDERYLSCETVGGLIVTMGAMLKQAEWRDTCRLHWPDGARVLVDMEARAWHP